MGTDSLSESYQSESCRSEIILCRRVLEYLAQDAGNIIDSNNDKPTKDDRFLDDKQLEIWNAQAGTYGGTRALGEMRYIIMRVLRKENFVENIDKEQYKYKITENGKSFLKNEPNIKEKLDNIWDAFDKCYKDFFTPEISKDDFKKFIKKWADDENIGKETRRSRDNANRVIAEIYDNPFTCKSGPTIDNFSDACNHNFRVSFGTEIKKFFGKNNIKEAQKGDDGYNLWGIDLCLKSHYEFNDNFKAALEELDKDEVIKLEKWRDLEIQPPDKNNRKNGKKRNWVQEIIT